MLESLDAMLRLALIYAEHTDRSTIKKLVIKTLQRSAPHVQKAIVTPVLQSKTPRATLFDHAEKFLDYNFMADELSGMGYVGASVVGGVAYGVKFVIEDVHDKQYVLANEKQMATKIFSRTMEELALAEGTYGEVVLFRNRGFTGMRYRFNLG